MMSFARSCKEEILNKKYSNEQLNILLLGMQDANYSEDKPNEFISSNLEIAEFFFDNLDANNKKMFETDSRLAKYHVTYDNKQNDFDYSLITGELRNIYLAGLFVARGSVNDPNTTKYHFEMPISNSKKAVFALNLINQEPFNAKIIKRHAKYVIYIKDAEKIVDILRILGALNQAFNYEDIRIQRDFNNSLNRVINCEVANEQKAFVAAREQLKYIKYLEYNYPLETLDIKIITLMKVRKDNPEATLNELIDIIQNKYGENLSKSGLYHRFEKIKKIAEEHYNNTNK